MICRIGQISRCRVTGCEWSKHCDFTCEQAKELNEWVEEMKLDSILRPEDFIPKEKRSKSFPKRRSVYKRSNGICYLCGEHVAFDEMTLDHVFPKSKGGTNHVTNLRAVHPECNTKKGNRILTEEEIKTLYL